jgi:uncharacterized protein YkwD
MSHPPPHRAARRRRSWHPPLLAALLFAGLLLASASQGPLPSSEAPLAPHELERQLLEHTNAERERAGLPALRHGEALALAARHHAREMAALGYFGHESPTPGRETLSQRVAASGGAVVGLGENIAQLKPVTEDLAERTVRGWVASEEHRANLHMERWTHVGHGVAEDAAGGAFVVQVFAADPNPLLLVEAIDAASVRLGFERSPGSLVFLVDDAPVASDVDGPEVTLALPGEAPFTVMTGRPLDDGQIAVLHAFRFTGEAFEPAPVPSEP